MSGRVSKKKHPLPRRGHLASANPQPHRRFEWHDPLEVGKRQKRARLALQHADWGDLILALCRLLGAHGAPGVRNLASGNISPEPLFPNLGVALRIWHAKLSRACARRRVFQHVQRTRCNLLNVLLRGAGVGKRGLGFASSSPPPGSGLWSTYHFRSIAEHENALVEVERQQRISHLHQNGHTCTRGEREIEKDREGGGGLGGKYGRNPPLLAEV